jgi:hypothetical protein
MLIEWPIIFEFGMEKAFRDVLKVAAAKFRDTGTVCAMMCSV